MGKNNTPYIVSFYKQQKNKKKGIKVVLQEDWYPVLLVMFINGHLNWTERLGITLDTIL